jgi:hypothetical protein
MNMTQNSSNEQTEVQPEEALVMLHNHTQQVLQQQFEDYKVEGQVGQHPVYGPIFAYTLQQSGKSYSCGFFFNELLHNFQTRDNSGQWISSFFVELIRNPESRPLPDPPQTEDEVKAFIDQQIVPYCTQSVRDEFSEETVHVDLELHPEQGPVLEAGFPSMKEGNNTCAMPLHYLMTLHLLNRDPAEPLIEALYKIHDEHQL